MFNKGDHVIVKEHTTYHTRWHGTSGEDFTARHNEYTGIIDEIYRDGGIMVLRDGTRSNYEDCSAEWLEFIS